ncbi:NRDE family protein [Tenacibaculum maritimum]|uniref:NRDE family protein n=1 Tax=Tenacibaculum maritimum TaxID=107401 RepID=UPI0010A4A399|nr:NRDE family protein [Tenacibaculum maritimum]QCD63119.1 hypothetical protein B9C57_11565 [Tenacibaculum maritimum]
MCTVTYLPLKNNGFILTSNRDENPTRKTIIPKEYDEDGIKILYPKDELAGGTWIGVSEKNRLICLLNGGFEKHKRGGSYRMSRGVIVKQLLQVDDPVGIINCFDFLEIEPFTIILVDWSKKLKTYELVWDGSAKHFKELPQVPKIWSSSTLYTQEIKQMREDWFSEWLIGKESFEQKDIVRFHKDTEKGTTDTSLRMKRMHVETVSVTSVKKELGAVSMHYTDLSNNRTFSIVQRQ